MSPIPDDDELTPLAEAISDGAAVDWEAQAARLPHLRKLVRELRVLEALAASCQGDALASEPGAPAVGPLHDGPRRWGRLVLLERLGGGSFGDVYRAFDPALQRDVALKLVRDVHLGDADASHRFLEEARRLARVRHPNIAVVHGVDQHDGAIGIWGDLVVGDTIEALLEQRGAFPAAEAAAVGIELSRALAAVHAAGLVHGDVKTTNVMRERGGRIVLLDFGAASEASSADAAVHGTPAFTAPEVLRGERTLPASDLYALGVLLYRLTSGRFPYAATTADELRAQQAAGERTPLRMVRPGLPPAFVRVVETALEIEPGRRFADATAMERALASHVRGSPGWTPAMWIMASGVAVGIVLAVILWPRPRPRPPAPAPDPLPVARELQVRTTLRRVRAGGTTTLAPGDSVAPGDALFLELASEEPLYVYVLDGDENGETFVLFPAPGLDLTDPLPAHTQHRLPGTRGGHAFDWQVTSAGGSETMMVVASRARLAGLERELAALEHARPERAVTRAAGEAEGMRGIGGMADRSPAAGAATDAEARLEHLLARSLSTSESAPWVWSIRLENRAR